MSVPVIVDYAKLMEEKRKLRNALAALVDNKGASLIDPTIIAAAIETLAQTKE